MVRFWLLLLLLLQACDFTAPHESESWKNPDLRLLHISVSDRVYDNLFSTSYTNEWRRGTIKYSSLRDTAVPYCESPDVLIRRQGNDARRLPKPSFTIKTSSGSRYALSAQFHDHSFVRELTAHHFFRAAGMETHYVEPVVVLINNTPMGLYLIREQIRDEYFSVRNRPLLSRYRIELGGWLTHTTGLHPAQSFSKKYPSRCMEYDDLSALLSEIDSGISPEERDNSLVNLSNFIDYYAVTQLIDNSDGIRNNFSLARCAVSKKFEIVPWDLDRTFFGTHDTIPRFSNGAFEQFDTIPEFAHLLEKRRREIFDRQESALFLDSLETILKQAHREDPYLRAIDANLTEEISQVRHFISTMEKTILQP
ncbi:CotH kinase family protein [Chitinivibrio alkaliphilus]|uniref:Spore coat protein CotH n=1 Tax=Chitinivibrio alkaliphilus ACht1 TaxID=1313304 RepID=U7D6J3_9BACT|nr:CotH kinase family protein [Chitinivibrio alkaliphilus]ERP30707.1 hypothetical protein CALK_2470 [Chitinivibrio alkaliphilus ACht1]